MTDTTPEPFVPAEVDLRDFQFMPLDVGRLRDSALVSEREPEEIVAAIMLWSASWHQVPASSLPDVDKQLANLAGYGRGVHDFERVKEGALHRFVKCSDGRWYHPVVAEKAAEGWNAKLKEEHRRACDRARKHNKERGDRGESPLPMPPAPTMLTKRMIDGFPQWRQWDSAGIDPVSAGTQGKSDGTAVVSDGKAGSVLRNSSLKGRDREGTVKGQGSTPTNDVNATEPGKPPGKPKRAAAIAVLLNDLEKARGKVPRFMSQDPRLQQWADLGVTDDQIREAHTIAVAEREAQSDTGPLNAGFFDVILAKVLNPTNGKAVRSIVAPKPWFMEIEGVRRKAKELGIEEGDDWQSFRAAVWQRAGVTDEEVRRARADR